MITHEVIIRFYTKRRRQSAGGHVDAFSASTSTTLFTVQKLCLSVSHLSFMATFVFAITLSMYSLGWIDGFRELRAPKKLCRFDNMMR